MSDNRSNEPSPEEHEPTPVEAKGSTLDLDTVFDVLRDQRRRYACYHFSMMSGDTVSVDELVANVLKMETDRDSADVSDTHFHHVKRTLYHTHLPKLTDTEVVAYDPDNETVNYRRPPLVDEWLERARQHEFD